MTSGRVTGRDVSGGHEAAGPGYGGAVVNDGALRMDNDTITGSVAIGGASAFGRGGSGNGGAIANRGTLVISHSTLTGNRASGGLGAKQGFPADTTGGGSAFGGAIWNRGSLQVRETEIDDNAADADGQEWVVAPFGLIRVPDGGSAAGGAIYDTVGGVRISRSTLAHNHAYGGYAGQTTGPLNPHPEFGGTPGDAEGGALYGDRSVTVESSTLALNSLEESPKPGPVGRRAGTGLDLTGTTQALDSDTIADNSGPGAAVAGTGLVVANSILQSCSGKAPVSQGYNLDQGRSCSLTGTADQSDVNPRLERLAFNGGPTRTMALPADSPAINKANSPFTTDQRGLPRPVACAGVPAAAAGTHPTSGPRSCRSTAAGRSAPAPAELAFGSQRLRPSPSRALLHAAQRGHGANPDHLESD